MSLLRWKIAVIVSAAASLFLGLALIYSVRTLSFTRSKLQSVGQANLFLRQTLGDMAVTVNLKDMEIDRLNSVCVAPGKSDNSPVQNRKMTH